MNAEVACGKGEPRSPLAYAFQHRRPQAPMEAGESADEAKYTHARRLVTSKGSSSGAHHESMRAERERAARQEMDPG